MSDPGVRSPAIVYDGSASAALASRAAALANAVGLSARVYAAAAPEFPSLQLRDDDSELRVEERLRPITTSDQLAVARRRALAGRRSELARACGWPLTDRVIIDATAGLGRDAAVLALLGARVTLIEREALLVAWLHEFMPRLAAAHAPPVVQDDALRALPTLVQGGEVLYLDPMFDTERSALPRRDAQALAALASATQADALFDCALALPCARIVVKRGRHQAPLRERPDVSHVITGRTVRFDVYVRGASTGAN